MSGFCIPIDLLRSISLFIVAQISVKCCFLKLLLLNIFNFCSLLVINRSLCYKLSINQRMAHFHADLMDCWDGTKYHKRTTKDKYPFLISKTPE